MPSPLTASQLEPHRRRLWGLAYRMTGSAADADELVQETYVRALERPPADTSRPVDNWLTKVTANLSRDRLRARIARPYVGPWLPAPVTDAALLDLDQPTEPGVDVRYDARESATIAFLVALEVLTPRMRAVLILRDVYGCSSDEVAEILELTTGAVKAALHRARAALESYDSVERPDAAGQNATVMETLSHLMVAFTSGDKEAMAKLLRADVLALSDGGGRYHAALKPLVGIQRVVKFMFAIAEIRGQPARVEVVKLNGQHAILLEFADSGPKTAPRAVMALDVDATGAIAAFYTVLYDAKLVHAFG